MNLSVVLRFHALSKSEIPETVAFNLDNARSTGSSILRLVAIHRPNAMRKASPNLEGSLKAQLNEALEGRFQRSTEYQSVQVLLLYWEESDDVGFKTEAYDIGQIFADDFRYTVNHFSIPTVSSQLRLNQRITEFLIDNRDSNTLLIVHYGGHADEDRHEPDSRRQSVWTSHRNSLEKIKWFEIQPILEQHPSEVFLLLDCCFGAQAGRTSRSPIPPNVELLAACAMNLQTPMPSSRSFTKALIKELKALLGSGEDITVLQVFKNLAHRDTGLAQTPIHFGLEGKKGTIHLHPFPLRETIVPQMEASVLSLQVSLRDPLSDQSVLKEVIDWLRNCAPRTVSSLSVEKVMLTASFVQQIVSEETRGAASKEHKKLPTTASNDIRAAWNSFWATVTCFSTLTKSPFSIVSAPKDRKMIEKVGELCGKQLESSYSSLEETLEHGVMFSDNLLKRDQLLAAIDNQMVQDLGFADQLKLRYTALFPTESKLSMEVKYHSASTSIPSPLSIETLPGMGEVIVECRRYTKKDIDRYKLEISMQRMQQLSELLGAAKSPSYHTLKCLRWFHDEYHFKYGLVFAIPQEMKGLHIMSLRNIIEKAHGADQPTLNQLFLMAHSIGQAILKWHTVGWVHQGITSRNVWFFCHNIRGPFQIEYSNPLLFGFEYARAHDGPSENRIVEDFSENVYRHPARQGYPRKSHRKEHDLYAYGVLLLEIGLWDVVTNLFRKRDISPHEVREFLLSITRKHLAHTMGEAYANATKACLNGDFDIDRDDKVESQLASAFKNLVLKPISRGLSL